MFPLVVVSKASAVLFVWMLESSAAHYDQTFIFTAVFKLIRFSWCKHDCVLTAVLMIERGNTPVNCTVAAHFNEWILQKNFNVLLCIAKVCTAIPAKMMHDVYSEVALMILANLECHRWRGSCTRKSQILISYLSDIPHNRHGSLCRHKLLQCHAALLQHRRFPNFPLFSSLCFNDVLHCATRAAVHRRHRADEKICCQEILRLLFCLLWLEHRSYCFVLFFC